MYPIMLLLLIPAISSEVIEDINLPAMTEPQVECLFDQIEDACPGGTAILKFVEKSEEKRTKDDVDRFITLLFIDYQTQIRALLPTQYADPTSFRNLWSAGTPRLFDKVFLGTNIGHYVIRTGYIWWQTILALAKIEHASIWKSDNCDKEDHCVVQACDSSEPTGIEYAFSYVRNTNPYVDLMIFTAAVYKGITKTFSSHQLTYNLKGGFLKESSYVTVVYKSTATDYSIGNVDVVYYSLKSNGPLGPIEVCGNKVEIPDLNQNYNCDIRSKDSPVCAGAKEFRDLRSNAGVKANQEAFVKLVIENEGFNKALTSYLAGDLQSELLDIWFSERNLFVNVFDDRVTGTKVKSGYLTLEYGDMKCVGPILIDDSPSNCTAMYADIFNIGSQDGMNITYLNKVNPLFDFTALTLAAARGRHLENLQPGKTVTLIAKKSDECQIVIDLLSLEGKTDDRGIWIMKNFVVGYKFYS